MTDQPGDRPVTVPVKVTVCALTFRRPDDLRELLPALAEQASIQSAAWSVDVLIVDNDPAGSARDAVELFARDVQQGSPPQGTSPEHVEGQSDRPVVVRYAHEARANIALARNRALDECTGSRLLVFLDDDERPSAAWLATLLATWQQEHSAAVVGPGVSAFPEEPAPWIVAGGFFVRRRMPTGTRTGIAATNNLLLDLDVVRRHGLRFNPDFGLTGGEDMLFTRQLHGQGEQIVWCDEAIVTDVVPPVRITRRWVTMRALSNGNSWGLTSMRLASGWRARSQTRATLLAQGLGRVAVGGTRAAAGLVLRRQRDHARGVKTLMRGLGMVSGAVGWGYQEYKSS